MSVSNGVGFKKVRVITPGETKNYIRVRQVDDLSIKNYINMSEVGDENTKNYINVVVVNDAAPKNYHNVNFVQIGPSICDAYLFGGSSPDSLTLGSPFTGNLKVIVIAASETGVHPDIIAGRQGSFVPSTNPLSDMQQNQYEIDAVSFAGPIVDATFTGRIAYAKDDVWFNLDMGAPALRWYYELDGVGANVSIATTLLPGDSISIQFTGADFSTSRPFFLSTPRTIAVDGGGNFYASNTGVDFTYKIDGVQEGNFHPAPTDGLMHTLEVTAINQIDVTHFGRNEDMNRFFLGSAFNLVKNDGSEVNIRIDDGPTSGGVLVNSGSGPNGALINEVAGDWYEDIE